MAFDYDLFVIGGGSGGVRAARLAASEAGAKVALAEERVIVPVWLPVGSAVALKLIANSSSSPSAT